MQKARFVALAIGVLAAVLVGACAPAAQPVAEPVVQQPVQPQPQAQEPAQQAPVVQAAPLCPATNAVAIDVSDTEPQDTYCVEKVPYQNILVPQGATFQVSDRSGKGWCSDQGTIVEGKKVIACSGEQLMTYQLTISGGGAAQASLVTGTGQCQEGYGFDAAQQCCAPLSGGGGDVTINVNMGACALPGSVR